MTMTTQTDLVKEISELAKEIPLARRVQLYEFALFLKTHPLPAEETYAEIIADEALWEAQFEATDDHKLAALVTLVEAEIDQDNTQPMFDENGKFIEQK